MAIESELSVLPRIISTLLFPLSSPSPHPQLISLLSSDRIFLPSFTTSAFHELPYSCSKHLIFITFTIQWSGPFIYPHNPHPASADTNSSRNVYSMGTNYSPLHKPPVLSVPDTHQLIEPVLINPRPAVMEFTAQIIKQQIKAEETQALKDRTNLAEIASDKETMGTISAVKARLATGKKSTTDFTTIQAKLAALNKEHTAYHTKKVHDIPAIIPSDKVEDNIDQEKDVSNPAADAVDSNKSVKKSLKIKITLLPNYHDTLKKKIQRNVEKLKTVGLKAKKFRKLHRQTKRLMTVLERYKTPAKKVDKSQKEDDESQTEDNKQKGNSNDDSDHFNDHGSGNGFKGPENGNDQSDDRGHVNYTNSGSHESQNGGNPTGTNGDVNNTSDTGPGQITKSGSEHGLKDDGDCANNPNHLSEYGNETGGWSPTSPTPFDIQSPGEFSPPGVWSPVFPTPNDIQSLGEFSPPGVWSPISPTPHDIQSPREWFPPPLSPEPGDVESPGYSPLSPEAYDADFELGSHDIDTDPDVILSRSPISPPYQPIWQEAIKNGKPYNDGGKCNYDQVIIKHEPVDDGVELRKFLYTVPELPPSGRRAIEFTKFKPKASHLIVCPSDRKKYFTAKELCHRDTITPITPVNLVILTLRNKQKHKREYRKLFRTYGTKPLRRIEKRSNTILKSEETLVESDKETTKTFERGTQRDIYWWTFNAAAFELWLYEVDPMADPELQYSRTEEDFDEQQNPGRLFKKAKKRPSKYHPLMDPTLKRIKEKKLAKKQRAFLRRTWHQDEGLNEDAEMSGVWSRTENEIERDLEQDGFAIIGARTVTPDEDHAYENDDLADTRSYAFNGYHADCDGEDDSELEEEMWDHPPMGPLDRTRFEDNSDTELYQSVSGKAESPRRNSKRKRSDDEISDNPKSAKKSRNANSISGSDEDGVTHVAPVYRDKVDGRMYLLPQSNNPNVVQINKPKKEKKQRKSKPKRVQENKQQRLKPKRVQKSKQQRLKPKRCTSRFSDYTSTEF
ncbi:hypothetical protein BDD12DRAFT_192796 [Trichophaea hybrida]|nr:hypothetical protein BDD12DRAFT_192796 [Trichophaea hybrida]